jgi:solute carrier family 10 (sodium/bile acid cotransporter), member 7
MVFFYSKERWQPLPSPRSVKESVKSETLLSRPALAKIGEFTRKRTAMDREIQPQRSSGASDAYTNGMRPAGRSQPPGRSSFLWATVKRNGFIIALLCAVGLAFLFPSPGAKGGWLHPDLLNNIGVALILFVQGLAMAVERMKSGAGNWRLHLIVQGFTFLIFPVVGWVFHEVTRVIWPGEPGALSDGFLYLCVLPSTVSTSVVLTTVARGNTAGAIFNAGLSNILGVIFTPLLVRVLMQASGQMASFGPLLLKITLLTLVPFIVGMGCRIFLRRWADQNRRFLNLLSSAVILIIVYTAFCDSVEGRVWEQFGIGLTLEVLGAVTVLFTTVSLLVLAVSSAVSLSREDFIAALFCSVKKTLAMGVPLAQLIFGGRANLGLILLPIMFYHPFQLFVCGLLANQFAASRSETETRTKISRQANGIASRRLTEL